MAYVFAYSVPYAKSDRNRSGKSFDPENFRFLTIYLLI